MRLTQFDLYEKYHELLVQGVEIKPMIGDDMQLTTYTRAVLEREASALHWSEPSMRGRQSVICMTKQMHGFNVTDIAKDMPYLRSEVDELEAAITADNMDNIAEELADIAIYCYGMCQMLGRDLDAEIFKKMAYNRQRTYPTTKEV